MNELKLQQDCFKWFHNTFPHLRGTLWKVENERKRSKYEQMIAKSTGLVSGVSDLNMVHQGTFYALELKTQTGKQSKTQKQWQQTIQNQKGIYLIAKNLQEFQAIINSIVKQP